MKEIVLQTVYKLDNSKGEAEQLQRIGSRLLSDVEKIFLFKKSEGNEKEDLEKYNYELNLSNLQFFDKLIRANLQLIRTERMIQYIVQQELQKTIQEKTIELKIMNEQKRMSDIAYQEQMAQIILQQLQQLTQQKSDSLNRLQDLIGHRNQLVESIQEHKKVIQASREVHQTEALKHVHEVKVGEVYTFEGMTPENQKKFIDGYFALEEIKARKEAEIDHKIKAETDAMANGVDSRKASGLVQNFQNKSSKSYAAIEKLKAEKAKVNQDFILGVKRLGDETGHTHINSKVNENEFSIHLSAFQNHGEIKKHIDEHKEVTKDQTEKILVAKEEVALVNADLKVEIETTKEVFNQEAKLIQASQNDILNSEEFQKMLENIGESKSVIKQIESQIGGEQLIDSYANIDLDTIDFDSLDLEDLNMGLDMELDLPELDANDIPDLNGVDFDELDFSTPVIASKDAIKTDQIRQFKSS